MSHVKEAVEALKAAQETPADENVTDPWLLAAQVHATLALVEQQRIANLIAMRELPEAGNALLKASAECDEHGRVTGQAIIRPEISEALGIEASR